MTDGSACDELSLTEILDVIGSDSASSGAGVAAAVALALAVACAMKAVSVSLKHGSDEVLISALDRLQPLRDAALRAAQLDAELFAAYLADHDARDAARLVIAAEGFQEIAHELERELVQMQTRVIPTVMADVQAAQSLRAAALTIEKGILRDNRRLRTRAIA